jgi:hypothetical protein
VGQTGQIASIIFWSRGIEQDILLKDGRIHFPTLNQLVDILGRKKIFLGGSISFQLEYRSIHLRFEGDLNLEISMNGGEAGEANSLLILLRGNVGVFRGVGRALQKMNFTLSAGGASTTGGVDMNSCFHSGLEEVLPLID